jgi:excisionase family DNA binding protein
MGRHAIVVPESVKAEMRRETLERPQVILPEDRDDFLAGVEPEHQVEAEQHYDALSQRNENFEREWRGTHGDREGVSTLPTQAAIRRQYLTVPQIADRWQVDERTIWRYLREGRLRSFKLGASRRILEEDVVAFENSAAKAVA